MDVAVDRETFKVEFGNIFRLSVRACAGCVPWYIVRAHTDPHGKLSTGTVTSQPHCRTECKDNLSVTNCSGNS